MRCLFQTIFGPILLLVLCTGCTKSTNQLLADLKDQEKWSISRARAAYALREHKDPRVVEPLIAALHDEDNDVRWGAVVALGEVGDSRAVEPLLQTLKDEDRDVRCQTAQALGRLGDNRARPALRAAMENDEDPTVRSLAARSLEEIETGHR